MNKSGVIAVAVAAVGLSAAGIVTKHYSFSNGYPTTTTRQPSSKTGPILGVSVSEQTRAPKKIEKKTLVGKVTGVESGDLIWVTPTGGRKTKVRFFDADAPEPGQNFSVEAKKFLFDLVNGKKVTVHHFTPGPSGTVHGTVMLEHEKGLVDVNLTLIKNGCAWYAESVRPEGAKADTSRQRAYAAAEADARKSKRGLWSAQNPVKPAQWRKLHQGKRGLNTKANDP